MCGEPLSPARALHAYKISQQGSRGDNSVVLGSHFERVRILVAALIQFVQFCALVFVTVCEWQLEAGQCAVVPVECEEFELTWWL